MKTDSPEKSAGARIRGAIQKGETGDKVPGFDPAAAPMETDAEAGGSSFPDNDAIPRSGGDPTKATESNASSSGDGIPKNLLIPPSEPEAGGNAQPFCSACLS